MFASPHRNRRPSLAAPVPRPWLLLAVGLALGCSETAELASALTNGKENKETTPANGSSGPNASGQPGSAAPTDPKPDPMAGTVPGTPRGGGMTAPVPPSGGTRPVPPAPGAACTMRADGDQVCVVCVDATTGKIVRQDCFNRGGGDPMGGACEETRQPDGTTCLVCKDANGNILRRGCHAPPSTCRPDPGTPAPVPVCRETEVNGARCTICTDPMGGEIRRACQMPPGTPPGPVTCEEKSFPDGVTCVFCSDAQGNVIKRACSGPVPEPPAPPMVTCKDYVENGARCTVCVDAAGAVVKQACAGPAMPTPMTPPAPMTSPITCHTFHNPNSTCIICLDSAGKVVKQDCSASATTPAQ
jgi:hypothetical protein